MNCWIKVFPAYDGDCIIISFGSGENNTNILIDGGRGRQCYQMLKNDLKVIEKKGQNDLLVVTHIDRDHISGILNLFNDKGVKKNLIKKVWFNSGEKLSDVFGTDLDTGREISLMYGTEVSVKQGMTLEKELKKYSLSDNEMITNGKVYMVNDARITILSPNSSTLNKLNDKWEVEKGNLDKNISSKFDSDNILSINCLSENKFEEDSSIPNGSSIAFLFELDKKKILLLGDSHPSVVRDSLLELGYSKEKKIVADVVKISHHGSKYNTNSELLELIDCQHFIISSNGFTHGLPHKECLSRIIVNNKNVKLLFNYPLSNRLFSDLEQKEYEFECLFLGEKEYMWEV